MYSKIICSEDHKKCIIPPKIIEKINKAKTTAIRVATIGGVFLVLTSFTACSGAKEIKNNIETTKLQVETTVNDNTTWKNEITTTKTQETVAIQTTKLTEIKKPTETTTKQTTQYDTSNSQSGIVILDATIEKYSKERLSKILDKVNVVLEKKDKHDFPELAKTFIRDGIEQIFNNYEDWRIAYKDLPTIEEYINESIIPAIENAGRITMIDYDSEEAIKMRKNGDATAATIGDNCDVYLMYKNQNNYSTEEHIQDVEALFHELKHCKDKKVLFDDKHFENDVDIREFFTDGGATFHEKLIKPLTSEHPYSEDITNSEGSKCVEYGKDDILGYMLDLYIYENLVYLAGYQTVEGVGQGNDLSTITDAIAKKYGRDTADKLWEDICYLYYNFDYESSSDDSFKYAIIVQNRILECIKQDIKNLDVTNKQQIREFMNIYRNYKIKIMPNVKNDVFDDITQSVFNTDELDDLLIQKIEESRAIKSFSNNTQLNRMALKSILLGNNNSYYRLDGICEDLYLPKNIGGTKYYYYSKEDQGNLIMSYTDKYGRNENIKVKFNKEKITSIGEAEEKELKLVIENDREIEER